MSTPTPPATSTAQPSARAGATSAAPEETAHARVHSTWPSAMRAALIASAVVSLVLLAFSWPSYTSKVRELPISVVGHPKTTAPIDQALAQRETFAVSRAADRASAVRDIQHRDSYGSIVVSSRRIEVLTASAASPVASQALNAVAQNLTLQMQGRALAAARQGAQVSVPRVITTDVVPLSADDPRGTLLAVAALPLAMGGMIGGVLISLLVVGHWRRVAAVLTYGIVGGLLLTLILDPWFGAIHGNFAVEWLAIGLALAATASLIVGLNSLIGPPGIGVGAVITLFLGNPLSSANSPQEFLPWHWGDIGQGFVPGAASTLLRLESYFPDAPSARYWWTLVLWTAFGTILSVLGHFRDQRVLPNVGGVEPDEPHTPRGRGRSARATRSRDDTAAADPAVSATVAPAAASPVGAEDRQAARTTAFPATNATSPASTPASGTAAAATPNTVTGHGLRGSVLTSDGRPVPGAGVTVTDEAGSEVGHTIVGADGTYHLRLPATGTYLVIAAAPGAMPSAERVLVAGPAHRHDIRLGAMGASGTGGMG